MFIRKLVKSGLASSTIALPKEWIDKHRLKKGDILYVSEMDGGGLLVTAEPKKDTVVHENKVIDVDGINDKSLRREIVANYLNNYQQIVLKGRNITKFAKIIKETSSNLIGMELIEEDSSKIVLRSFVHLSDSYPDQILRRVDNIIRSMIIDTKVIPKDSNMVEIIKERDDSVNKFVYLLIKVIKASMIDPNIARQLNLKPVHCLFYWEIALHLEKIGDGVKRYARRVRDLSKNGKAPSKMIEIIDEFYKSYENAMKSFYLKNTEVGDIVASGRDALSKKCDEFTNDINKIEAGDFSGKIKSMLSHLTDITRFARYTT